MTLTFGTETFAENAKFTVLFGLYLKQDLCFIFRYFNKFEVRY